MKVAIIGGTGDLGFGLALRWARAGFEVLIGSREQAKAEAATERLREQIPEANVSGHDNGSAAAGAPVAVVAVPFSGVIPIYRSIANHLTPETVIVDATVPVEASLGGKATHVFGV